MKCGKNNYTVNINYFSVLIRLANAACLGQSICKTPEEFKAWSQNLGHDSVMTTFHSYSEVQVNRQAEILRELTKPPEIAYPNADILAEAVARRLHSMNT